MAQRTDVLNLAGTKNCRNRYSGATTFGGQTRDEIGRAMFVAKSLKSVTWASREVQQLV